MDFSNIDLNTFWHYKEEFGYFLSGLTAIGFAKIGYDVWKGGQFIADVLSDVPITRLQAYRKMLTAVWHAKALVIDFKAQRLAAARYIAELEILMPDLKRLNRVDYDPKDFDRIQANWERLDAERKKLKRTLFRSHFASQRFGVAKWLWLGFVGLFSRTGEKPTEPMATNIPITDIPSLDDSRTLIKHYFDALEELGEATESSFISTAEFRIGYLAPLYLLTGLINRFGEEEGWKLILNNYGRLIERDREVYSAELVELRSFLFNCWLLWGPSISPCGCERWECAQHNARNDVILQYGFGDENNSIDVLIKGGKNAAAVRKIKDRLNSMDNTQRKSEFNPIATMAAPFSIKGTFRWGPILGDQVPPAQKSLQGGETTGRIVLECESNSINEVDTAVSSKYYSAYIWIMFSIETMDGKDFFPDARWKNLLVYFEHGNIAEAATFQTLKESLVTKACSSIAEILKRTADRNRLRIKYACALDDSFCCPEKRIMFQPKGGILEGSIEHKKETRLVEIMAEMIRRHPEEILRSGRLLMPSTDVPEGPNPYGSCMLPEIVDEFYLDLRRPDVPSAPATPTAQAASPQQRERVDA
jgi:hypothetical protein